MRLVRLFLFGKQGNQLPETRPRGDRKNPMKPARKVCDDGFPPRPEGEEARFAAEKLDAEGRRVSRAHSGGSTRRDRRSLARGSD
jgi:hypothetical protein